MSEPIHHHYIPQFILRNFASEQGYFSFYEKESGKVSLKEPKNVFVVPNLYKNRTSEEPMEIERDLSKYEGEIAPILKGRFLSKKEFDLTVEELESLLLFFAIMYFRSKRTSDAFGEKVSPESKEFYGSMAKEGDIHAFWNKNLGRLVKHRSIREVAEDPEIDEPIKLFMFRDTRGMLGFGLFPVLVERRGDFDFLLSDSYPSLMTGDGPNGFQIPLYEFYPLSPNRMLILISGDICHYHPNLRPFGEDITRIPFSEPEKGLIHIKMRKFYEKDVRIVNAMALANAELGAVIKDPSRVKFETDWRSIL